MLALLRALAVNAAAFFAGKGVARRAIPLVAGGALGAGGLAAGLALTDGNGPTRRRRRRRALSCQDRADLAFIRATLGQPAAREALGVIIARCG